MKSFLNGLAMFGLVFIGILALFCVLYLVMSFVFLEWQVVSGEIIRTIIVCALIPAIIFGIKFGIEDISL